METGATGIEITQVLHPEPKRGPSLRTYESHTDMVMESARQMWDDAGRPTAYVNVSLDTQLGIARKEVDELAARLVELVGEVFDPDGFGRIDWSWQQRKRIPKHFRSILVHPLRREKQSMFTGGNAIMAPDLSESLIRERLADKENRLDDYRKVVGTVWLLIVAPSSRGSGIFDDVETALSTPYTFGFDRAFLLQTFEGAVHELIPSNQR